MSLPEPTNENLSEWYDSYRISTPTFQLTPVEKPDFSPFLIHMTGKNSLVSILNGENAPDGAEIGENEGYLKAVIPDFEGKKFYNSEVVCFTESPIFALDFFRYRAERRFLDNQQFGIGFSKSKLVSKKGVRPVIYLDTSTNASLLSFCNKIIEGKYKIARSDGKELNYKDFFAGIKPLLFPLLEKNDMQGFMWEREWRCPDNQGLVFSHRDIEIICCPKNEREGIEQILGDLLSEIEIIESWKEYADVTAYLKRRKSEVNEGAFNRISRIQSLSYLNRLKSQNEQTLNALSSYYSVFKETTETLEGDSIDIKQLITTLEKRSDEITERIKKVEEEIELKEEQSKMKNKKDR